jgi:hypothetical protein
MLDAYQKAHLDDQAEITRSLEEGDFHAELEYFKETSNKFVDQLSVLKKNFTMLLNR